MCKNLSSCLYLSGKKRRRFLPALCFCFILLAGSTALSDPYIDLDPVSPQNVDPGQMVTFVVKVGQTNATTPLSVLWRRNGKNVPGSLTVFSNVTGIETAVLTITNAEPASAGGTYKAVVFDSQGIATSQPATLSFSNQQTIAATSTFSSRILLSGTSGAGKANNLTAVYDPAAPKNDGIPGEKMVWVDWLAPTSGIVSMSTEGSDFDTTLGVYKLDPNGSGALSDLLPVTADDDSGDFYNSAVRFNAIEGDVFTIGIDGYYGNRGQIALHWDLLPTEEKVPEINLQPKSQTVLPNEAVWLDVDVNQTSGSNVTYKWFFNGTILTGETNSVLYLSQVDEYNVGQYRVKVGLQGLGNAYSVLSKPAQIQINTVGTPDALAGNKLQTTADTTLYQTYDPPSENIALNALIPKPPPILMMTPVSGYTGTQIFSTYASSHEPDEPDHCGQVGGSSTWFSYLPTDTGILSVEADTDYEAVLAAYEWPAGGTSYVDLISVDCSSTNVGAGVESTSFTATNGTTYYLVVDGASGGYGTVTLSYELSVPPQISSHPQSHTVLTGSNALLSVTATGIPDPTYQWRMDHSTMIGDTNTSLTLAGFSSPDEGSYDVVVSNSGGAITSSAASLYLADPLRIEDHSFSSTGISMIVLGTVDSNYVIQSCGSLINTNWVPIITNSSPYGIIEFETTNSLTTQQFYRVESQ